MGAAEKSLTPFPPLCFDPHARNPGHHLGVYAWQFLFGVSFCFLESTGLSSFVCSRYLLLFLTVAILLVSERSFFSLNLLIFITCSDP